MQTPTAEKFFRVLQSISAAPTAAKVRSAALAGLRQLQAADPSPSRESRELKAVFRTLVVEQCNDRLRTLASRRHSSTTDQEEFHHLREAGLTRRECEVLAWIAQGKRDADIARILGISPRTVGKHIEHLLHKLRAETRTAAVNLARQTICRPRIARSGTNSTLASDRSQRVPRPEHPDD